MLSFDGVQSGDKDFKALVTRLKPLGADLLYYGGTHTEGGLLLRQAREAGVTAVYLTGEISYTPDFLRIAGPSAEGAYVTYLGRPAELMPTARSFLEHYRRRFPKDEVKAYDHFAYEAASILLAAMEQAGPDRARLIEQLRRTRHSGVLGLTTFDDKGDTLNRTVTLFVIREGRFVPVE